MEIETAGNSPQTAISKQTYKNWRYDMRPI